MATQMVNGGWYEGKQYWDGKLGAPGVIMNPNEVGFGQVVSSEVNKQSDKAQGLTAGSIDAYLAGLRGDSATASTVVDPMAGATNVTPGADIAGVTDLTKQYDNLQKQVDSNNLSLANQKSSINENPWGAEATRTGKISKLESYANDKNKILIDQQSNILNKITQAKEAAKIDTSVQTVDDGTNVYSVVINSKTGELIKKTVIGASKPMAKEKTTTAEMDNYYSNALKEDAQSGVPLEEIFARYSGKLDPNVILNLYNATSSWGPAKQTDQQLSIYGVKPIIKELTYQEQLAKKSLGL